jgi:enolase/phosphoenolpyruvate synthase/pyruvate phosphate dikinase
MGSATDVNDAGSARVKRALLQEGWVIANHILVSFHAAFISSVLAIPGEAASRAEVLRFIFLSPEALVSAAFTYIVFHTAVALHELGHFLEAARLRALNDSIQDEVEARLGQALPGRLRYLAGMFLRIPYGTGVGVKREGLNYYPDAPYNLAVAAAGPRASLRVARVALPLAAVLLAVGLLQEASAALYAGRLLLGLGLVTGLDFLLADRGKYREFRRRERGAADAAATLPKAEGWLALAPEARQRLIEHGMEEATHPRLGRVRAPWQFRNCGMGGRHTEKEYPESNISMQEAMFVVLGAQNSQEAQEMTVRLQNRLKEILESAEGCRVMGIGLEGGLAPYVDRGDFDLPELRLWSMMKQTIEECGYRPGVDVALALDPAMSELEIAYREEFDVPDAVGMYLFWRDRARKVLDRDGVLAVYEQALLELDIPILSIEDGFSETDAEGWRKLLERLGDRILVIGDDLVTTNDRTIERAAQAGLINTVLVKANQIGTLYETLLAILVALGKGLELVVSHRSKSPNDDMEAHIALAANALGLKAGGGANTERLVKYQAVATQMERIADTDVREPAPPEQAVVKRLRACEVPTNAGIPTVGVDLELTLPIAGGDGVVLMDFHGATPLGTSAGTGEAVHRVDASFEGAEYREVVSAHSERLHEVEPGVYAVRADLAASEYGGGDAAVRELERRAKRYDGNGCLFAVDHVHEFIAPLFQDENVAEWSLLDIDRALLGLELATAERRGKIAGEAPLEVQIRFMQRKQNLGMNAILSTSLALARGVARVRGQELYEFLREELLVIIGRLAAFHDVPIEGSRFEDYLVALREVNARLDRQGKYLHEALREATAIYDRLGRHPSVPRMPLTTAPVETAAEPPFDQREQELIAALNRALEAAYGKQGTQGAHGPALRCYLETMASLRRRYPMFEIANHRLFRAGGRLLVPYDAQGRLSIHAVGSDADEVLAEVRVPHGTLITDRRVAELAGEAGAPVDLEREIYHLEVGQMPAIQVSRLRDLAQVLEGLNTCGSRHEAVYLLRFLVARFCSTDYRGIASAKNLMPEITRVRNELVGFMNGPFAERLRLPTRILVRSISGMVSRPRLIDEVWQDTIDLAEVRVRGSAIANEIRRSTHHAMGKQTLTLAQSYLDWLRTGQAAFAHPGREAPTAADEAARGDSETLSLVSRIVANLEQLLGTSRVATRIAEWRESYATELLCCESTNSLEEELGSLVRKGIRDNNRWVYQHRLRSLVRKARQGQWAADASQAFEQALQELSSALPGEDGFDADAVERKARAAVEGFARRLQLDHQERLFEALDDLVACYQDGDQFQAFERCCALRHDVENLVGRGVFAGQRYLLHQLDCILEELGYFALRHLASDWLDTGIDLAQCLGAVHLCAGNLELDGLYSRELWDLSAMLAHPNRSASELLDVLEQIQRNYHRLVHRVSEAYHVMAGQLGYSESEMRGVLGNFQRTMHDLNSLVHFSDLARAHVAERRDDLPQLGRGAMGENPWDFAHLSHTQDIRRRVEDRDAVSLQARYGGKGSGLIYISYLGVPTRDAFIIPTVLARMSLHRNEADRLDRDLLRHVRVLEADIARNDGRAVRLGDPEAPLLLAVRGGSVFSMPGQLSTVVFVGMTEAVVNALAREDEWFAWDAYRRFLASYAAAVWHLDLEELDLVEEAKRRHGVTLKIDLPGSAMREVVEASRAAIREAGHASELDALTDDAELQLKMAMRGVLDSWNGERAKRYRVVKHLSEGWNTAVIVQEMAAGNRSNEEELKAGMDESRISLTGVIPSTRMSTAGFRVFTGDVKFSACGDDLVGGLTAAKSFEPVQELHAQAPMLERKLNHISARLRRYLGSDAEIEFTVERGILSVLQTRSAQMELQYSPRTFAEPGKPAGRGIGINGGAFRGVAAFDEQDVERLTATELPADADGILLVLENPIPDEIPLILSVDGLLAARGGSTSHAAVAVHGIDEKPFAAVLGVAELHVYRDEAVLVGGDGDTTHTIRCGDIISIHGQTGEVYFGARRILSTATDGIAEGAAAKQAEKSF